jgi:hypothetical protein
MTTTGRESLSEKNRRTARILLGIVASLIATCFWVGTRW